MISAYGQLSFHNQTESLKFVLHSIDDTEIEQYLIEKFNLDNAEISIKKTFENKSLTGRHLNFSCFFREIEILDVYIKVHINNKNQIHFLQYNLSENLHIQVSESDDFKENVEKTISEQYSYSDLKEIWNVNEQGKLEKGISVLLYNELSDFYVERTYYSENNFTEKSLKRHFAANDTILKGAVFLPDPLTSAGVEYGDGNYKDAFEKDTSLLVIKIIPNVGQAQISVAQDSLTLYGQKFFTQPVFQTNEFEGNEVFFIFDNIYVNIDMQIVGYNTKFVDDTVGFITQIITEDFHFPELNNEKFSIEVLGDYSTSKFRLKNDLFQIDDFSSPAIMPFSSPINNFNFSRSSKAFEEINIFYHVNNFHEYIENLGFKDLDPQKIIIDAHGNNGADNSYFTNSPNPRIVFGDGGVDDGEDADVIIHEYIHALSSFAAPNSYSGAERMALDEALGDYFASSYSSQYSDYNISNIYTWDGHNEFWNGRITNSDSTYESYNESNSIYINGQIWSATLMDIFNMLGKDIADKIVLESMYYNVKEATLLDAANVLVKVDEELFDNPHDCIKEILTYRKFKIAGWEELESSNNLCVFGSEEFSKGQGNARFFIFENDFESYDYWISNTRGSILEKNTGLIDPNLEISPDGLNTGIYYIGIQTNNNKYWHKLLKK